MSHAGRGHLGIRAKAMIFIVTMSTLGLGILATTFIIQTRERISEDEEFDAILVARGIAAASQLPMAVKDKVELTRLLQRFVASGQVIFVAAQDESGRLLAHASDNQSTWSAYENSGMSSQVVLGTADVVLDDWDEEGDLFAHTGEEELAPQSRRVGRIVVGLSNEEMHEAKRAQTRITVLMVIALGMAGALVSLWITGRLARRIGSLVHASERIARGDLAPQPLEQSPDELGRLARAYEQMRESICRRDRDLRDLNASLQDQVQQRTADLQKAVDVAEAANRAKSAFLANMSHEIRTPMTAILGYAELLKEPHLNSDDRVDCVETIERNGRHLLTIINDILDISKIESGRMTIERIRCSPAHIVSEIESVMRIRAEHAGISLVAQCASPIPETIITDPLRLRQIIFNLVGNAIKFTPKGEVHISVGLTAPSESAPPQLYIEVADPGVGMARAHLDKVFEPFTQADASTTRTYGGTGLGLTISRKLTRMLGGDLSAKSERGRGSVFRATIDTGPITGVRMIRSLDERPPMTGDGARHDNARARLTARILLAEDGVDNQRLIRFFLESAGATVELAENGRIAVDRATTALRQGTPFDLILMDMQMPELDGYGATRLLRERGYVGPIIALTAHAMTGDDQDCLEAGCDGYEAKPIRRDDLINACAAMLKRDRNAA